MTQASAHPVHIEVDGSPAAATALLASLMTGYGHFTAMQVREGRVRGLDLHLGRLDRANRELFGEGLDGDRVRALLRGALEAAGRRDGAVRVYVYPDTAGGTRTVVTVREPFLHVPAPQSLKTVDYWRPAAHLKHLGGFGQSYFGEAARREGFDEALLTSPYGEIAEGAVTNIAFWDGTSLIWPSAPCLHGITMALLEPRLGSVRRRVARGDLPEFRAAFVTNSRGISPVDRIDEVEFAVDEELMGRVHAAYESVPWDEI
ncbi:aminotransferase class IV [Streptomyces sp. ISL-36]|uniref:aminotransferase class IV n=1 Tax=Streptomyces sp. ISL-36 TaxID=2819182 RepID=UPI001BE76D32|nr:aminotransferase class IV [Streptomyces sp. ISL-36]MBT2440126.1 aminotransferase class IV [Streptomyces sp. ISL-36]